MKYFFVSEKDNTTNIIVAKSIESAKQIALNSDLMIKTIYELTEDTFSDEGFLVSDKSFLTTVKV